MTSYPGGKGGAGVYQAIINQMPPHEVYIEPFLGAGSVMRHKRPAALNIGIDRDPAVVDRAQSDPSALQDAELIAGDGIAWLTRRQWTGRELVYADPPYLISARAWPKRYYEFELTDADHVALLALLKRLPCMVMVSGYASPLYAAALADWRLVTFTAATRGAPATEHLWCNFPEPKALHDCRYLGADRTDRQRIKRKAERWRVRFSALDPLERQAVLSACFGDDGG